MRVKAGLLLLGLLAGCVAPRSEPPPAPPPPPPPAPPPPPPAPPPSADWRDWPLTPGTWTYAAEAGGSAARYGAGTNAVLIFRCTIANRSITLSREGAGTAAPAMFDITTSAGRQSFRGESVAGRAAVAATFRANDPFLDKMAFSRGRFIVSVSGTSRLVIPSWPEVSRVIEDCRG